MMVMMVTMLVRVLSLMTLFIIEQVALDLFIFNLFLGVIVTMAMAMTVAMMMLVSMVTMVMVVFVLTTKMVVSIT